MIIEEIPFSEAEEFLQQNAKASELMSPIKEGTFFAIKDYNVVLGKNIILGTIGYREREHSYKIDGHYVLQGCRKRGIGSILFDHILNILLSKTPKDIIAYATNDSIGFYTRNGFVVQKAYKKTYLVKRTMDENILQ